MSAHGFDDSRNDPHLTRSGDYLHNPLGDRSGREPLAARSPLRLRLVLSLIGAVAFAVVAVLLLVADGSVWLPVVAIGLAGVGLADAAVIVHRLRRSGN